MNYTTRDPDNTYVFLIEDDADKTEVHLRCYDAESRGKINVYIQKTSLPDWVVDGYHKLKVAGNGVDVELSDGWAVKRGDRYWFLADAFQERQRKIWEEGRELHKILADPGT
jgi:hypothetical protein